VLTLTVIQYHSSCIGQRHSTTHCLS